MDLSALDIPDLLLLKPIVFKDDRGSFYESYKEEYFINAGLELLFQQDNQSVSHKNVIRGIHLQNPPYEQGKLVRVVCGKATDVVVDVRKKSKFYGKHVKVELSEKNNLMLWVPAGFAHGFVAHEDNTVFLYKCTKPYNKNSETGIRWDDKTLNIDWDVKNPIVSEKDQKLPDFKDFISEY
jgi:dTDP-4-dehydrorhamnose 3,5-epimerase